MKKQLCLIIDGLGTATAISVLKGLSLQNQFNVFVVGLDMDELCAGRAFVDKFVKCPSARDAAYPDFCFEVLYQYKPDIWIPIVDYGFDFYSRNLAEFKGLGCRLMIGPNASLKKVLSKYHTYRLFEELGVPTPRTWRVTDFQPELHSGKFVTKPDLDGRASIDVSYHDNASEVLAYFSQKNAPLPEKFVVQEALSGIEFTADCLSDLDGHLIEIFARARLETKGGLSVKATALDAGAQSAIKREIEKIAGSLKLPGSFNVQGCIQNDRSVSFFEVNPRFAGGHPLTIRSGLNSIHLILQMMAGQVITSKDLNISFDISMCRYWQEVFVINDDFTGWVGDAKCI